MSQWRWQLPTQLRPKNAWKGSSQLLRDLPHWDSNGSRGWSLTRSQSGRGPTAVMPICYYRHGCSVRRVCGNRLYYLIDNMS